MIAQTTTARNPRIYAKLDGDKVLIVTGKRGRPGKAGHLISLKVITGKVPTGYGYTATFVRITGADGRKWVGQVRNASRTVILRPGR